MRCACGGRGPEAAPRGGRADATAAAQHLSVVDQPSIRTIAPHQLRYLTRLRTLTLSGLKIHTLPDALGEIASTLTSIDLSNDTFSEVPPVLCKLTELKSLNLSDNELGDVPHEIEALHNLEGATRYLGSPTRPLTHDRLWSGPQSSTSRGTFSASSRTSPAYPECVACLWAGLPPHAQRPPAARA